MDTVVQGQQRQFSTGPSTLPDVGVCSYNGCVFSPLFESNVSGKAVPDEARRTIIYMEYIITLDGYVNAPDGAAFLLGTGALAYTPTSTDGSMRDLRRLLSKQGGALNYTGRGNDIIVNVGDIRDVKWGPIPEILEFQPLGAGRSAKIKWTVKVAILEEGYSLTTGGGGKPPPFTGPGKGPGKDGGRVKPGPSRTFIEGVVIG